MKDTTTTIEPVADHDGEVDFTRTLRDIWKLLDETETEFDEACAELDNMRDWAEGNDGLSEDARKDLLRAIERAIDAMCDLRDACHDEAPGAIDEALDAFKRLPMDD